MNIDMKFLQKCLMQDKDKIYLFRLYKNYELCKLLCNDDIKNNHDKLDKYEEDIYTTNGVILSDYDRLCQELQKIYPSYLSIGDINLLKEIKEIVTILKDIERFKDEVQKSICFDLKKRMSVIEAKLDLDMPFFYAASCAFIDEYDASYEKIINNDNIGIKKYYYDMDNKKNKGN